MKHTILGSLLFAGAAVLVAGGAAVHAQSNMSFFITSVGKGDGANLGGLAGADAHCAALAKAAGSTKTNWRAYLSATQVPNGAGPVDARDRIGKGPWVNAKGVTIAKSVDDLHDPSNANLTKANLLTEKGTPVNGRGDTPNTHDILTGSDSAGRYMPNMGAPTPPAATGPRMAKAPPSWAITTAAVPTPTATSSPGTPPMVRRAAARTRWSRPAARASSTASRLTNVARPEMKKPGSREPGFFVFGL